ncbi:MAG: hypothetical protein ACJAUG_003621 [Halioglobus sp.]|jgi:hypothetical protein
MPNSLQHGHFDGSTFLTNRTSGNVSVDVTFLIASLLVYAAKGDGSISQLETDNIIRKLLVAVAWFSWVGSAAAALVSCTDSAT